MILCDAREGKGFPLPGGAQAHVYVWPMAFKCLAVSPKLQKNPY